MILMIFPENSDSRRADSGMCAPSATASTRETPGKDMYGGFSVSRFPHTAYLTKTIIVSFVLSGRSMFCALGIYVYIVSKRCRQFPAGECTGKC